MATTQNYELPLIDPAARFDGANDINKLAQQIDNKMKQVETLGKDSTYTLPPATDRTLGGVKIGANVNVAADGTISTEVDPYELPAASRSTLGGVIVGDGFNLTPDGTLSIDDQSVTLPANSVTTEQIQDGAVTSAKVATGAITYEKLAISLKNLVDEASDYASGTAVEVTDIVRKIGDANSLKAYIWGPVLFIRFASLHITGDGNKKSFELFTLGASAPIGGIGAASGTYVPLTLGDASDLAGRITASIDGKRLYLECPSAPAVGDYTVSGFASFVYGVGA